uniref:Kinesin motor domain-containing protein n=1 Tax=Percolomonas cosmopolitus TaxID=63605 RepID=A0A7S1PIX9_9EUKA|mmetsp:Transcript_8055/g.29893  ORF Transcript_8055/g.29893 Transcript_8055/m.29893 type:complete len:796 (+) Transcript_8055:4428-6815(+)
MTLDPTLTPHESSSGAEQQNQTAHIIQKHFNHVRVGVRLAPITATELQNQAQRTIEVKPPNTLIAYYPESGEGLLYEFDFVFEQRTAFEDIFKKVGFPSVNCFLEGYNSCIMSYGPSRTGKTELFFGSYGGQARAGEFGNEDETGLITNCLKETFTYLANAPDHISYTVIFSFWEMNNNDVFDLLNPQIAGSSKKNPLKYKVRRHPEYGVYITNLSEVEVRSWDELEELIDSGTIISQKQAHQRGTRWHSFLKLTLIREDARQPELTVKSSLSFINLKGTDRIGQLGAKGQLLKEGASLNQSMTALGTSIHNVVSYTRKRLSQAQNAQEAHEMKKTFPRETFGMFGDSKITAVLSEALSGNTCTSIVCSVSPTEFHYLETMDALENIRIASHIPSCPQRGDVTTEAFLLHQQIEKLRQEVGPTNLAEGHPLSESQEKLHRLEQQFKELTSGVQDEIEDMHRFPTLRVQQARETKREPEPLELPEDADTRLWKKNHTHSLKHGSRHTFYHPKKSGFKTTYKGQWSGNERSGEGTLETDTFKYTGGWKDGKRDGYGVYWKKAPKKKQTKKAGGMLSDPSKKKKHVTNSSMKKASNYTRIYAGFWRDGKKHGEGIYYYKNGDIYDGEWREDKRSGEGTLFVANGTKYEGEWYNDAQEGFGILYELNGNRYEGQFQEGKKHGSGVYYYVDKCRRYKGEWIEDVAKCGEISDYNKDVDESDAEIERMTGEVILLPKVQLRDHQSVLEEMKIHLRNAYAEKQQGRTNADGPFAAEEIYSDEEGGGESFENQLIKNMRDMDF